MKLPGIINQISNRFCSNKRKIRIALVVSFTIVFGFNLSCIGPIYTNDMDCVLGDVKQASIQNKITTEAQLKLTSNEKIYNLNSTV